MRTLWQDLRYGLRMLAKSRGFTAIAVLTLTVGVGAKAAIFSLTDQLLLRFLPVERPAELVVLRAPGPDPGHTWSASSVEGITFSYPMYKDLRDRSQVFTGLLARFPLSWSITGLGHTERGSGELLSGQLFRSARSPAGARSSLQRKTKLSPVQTPGGAGLRLLDPALWQ